MKYLLTLSTILMLASKNPVKLSMIILMISGLIMGEISFNTGETWFPLIMALLFTGGVLIMFMILSSFYPNESVSKSKMKWSVTILLVTLFLSTFNQSESTYTSVLSTEKMKTEYQNMQTSMMITVMVLIYFDSFMKILSKEKSAMRMMLC